MTPENFDAIIIGTGQSGKPLAGALGQAGWKTAVIERKHVGGTCINYGCTPTKTMVASARVAYLARRGADYGVHTGRRRARGHGRGLPAQAGRSSSSSATAANSYLQSTPNVELRLRRGAASPMRRRCESRSNAGGERLLTAPKIVINTGGRPAVPPIPGLDRRPLPRLDEHHGARDPAVAPRGARRRLHRPRVRPDVPPLRRARDDRATATTG